jgi:UTP--glucose-1-phosphate uridylyltransferase
MSTTKKRVRKAVFPVAGLGTRFLPATKAVPKEMLTVVDRPVIQHVVDEAKAAGSSISSSSQAQQGVIEDHFGQFELERTRRSGARRRSSSGSWRSCLSPASQLHAPAGPARPRPRGVVRARDRQREPFAPLLPDMLHFGPKPCLADMIEAYEAHGGNHIAVSPVPGSDAPLRHRRRRGQDCEGLAHHRHD